MSGTADTPTKALKTYATLQARAALEGITLHRIDGEIPNALRSTPNKGEA